MHCPRHWMHRVLALVFTACLDCVSLTRERFYIPLCSNIWFGWQKGRVHGINILTCELTYVCRYTNACICMYYHESQVMDIERD